MRVLITGASGGIGAACVQRFLDEGHEVVGFDLLPAADNAMPEDFFSIDLMDAYEHLGTILGESLEEDLVNEIFSHFCMGK